MRYNWVNMILPIEFPSDAQVIAEEVARFRNLSPDDRVRTILGVHLAGMQMMQCSPKAAFMRQYTLQQEELTRQAIKEFITRHASRARTSDE